MASLTGTGRNNSDNVREGNKSLPFGSPEKGQLKEKSVVVLKDGSKLDKDLFDKFYDNLIKAINIYPRWGLVELVDKYRNPKYNFENLDPISPFERRYITFGVLDSYMELGLFIKRIVQDDAPREYYIFELNPVVKSILKNSITILGKEIDACPPRRIDPKYDSFFAKLRSPLKV